MNSFRLTAVGTPCAKSRIDCQGRHHVRPLLSHRKRLCERDREGRASRVVTSPWFIAFGKIAESIARPCRGDPPHAPLSDANAAKAEEEEMAA